MPSPLTVTCALTLSLCPATDICRARVELCGWPDSSTARDGHTMPPDLILTEVELLPSSDSGTPIDPSELNW